MDRAVCNTAWVVRRIGLRLGLGFRVGTGESLSPLPTPASPVSGDRTRGILFGGDSPVGEVSSRRQTRVAGVTIVEGIVSVTTVVSQIVAVSVVVSLDLE